MTVKVTVEADKKQAVRIVRIDPLTGDWAGTEVLHAGGVAEFEVDTTRDLIIHEFAVDPT